MANFNKVMLIGRLTRDPESRTFANGGKVVKIGFAVTNRRKNSQSGQWEDEPMFIDVEVFNRGEFGKLADLVQDRCRKGSQIMIEGRLHLDQWEDKNGGGKRSKHKIVAESIQLLDGRPQDGSGGAAPRSGGGYSHPIDDGPGDDGPGPSGGGGGSSGKDEEIPF
jgi:single-strand DNA-binding protein